MAELITVCKRSKMTQALEAGLIGYISFFKYVISFLSVDTLKNLMQVCTKPFYLVFSVLYFVPKNSEREKNF